MKDADNADEVRSDLVVACCSAGGQKAFAEKHKLSPAYVNDMIQGRRYISDDVAYILGWERKVRFIRIRPR